MGTTGTYGLPFPEDTDPVAQGATAIEALAEAVEELLAANLPWQAYVPTLTGVAATVTEARYCKIGRLVTGRVLLTLTAGGGGIFAVGVPVPARAIVGEQPICGIVEGTDQGVGYHQSHAHLASTTRMEFWPIGGSGSLWQGGIPFAWAAGDTIRVLFEYESAA
jgi:hypothetical protein